LPAKLPESISNSILKQVISNYYTLRAVAREIERSLASGALFQHAFSQRSDELRLAFDSGITIVAQLKPVGGTLWLLKREEKIPKQNILSFFPELVGQTLLHAAIASTDRVIDLTFAEHTLRLSFFGDANATLLGAGKIVGAFKRKKAAARTERERPLQAKASPHSLLGKRLLEELTERQKLASVEDPAVVEQRLLGELRIACVGYVYKGASSLLLSPIALVSAKPDQEVIQFPSISEAIRFVVIERVNVQRSEVAHEDISRELETLIRRNGSALRQVESGLQNSARAEKYTAIANAILTNASEIPHGASEYALSVEDEIITIKLDPELSSYKNADRYFEKSRRSRDARKDLLRREQKLREEGEELRNLKTKLADSDEAAENAKLHPLIAQLRGKSSLVSTRMETDDDPLARFRQFRVAGGYEVLVGKNAKQNDELTQRVAKKEDIWLHARGVAGSHVVLRVRGNGTIAPPKEAIEQAAEIAAYFSDAKTQSLAPVIFTKKKFVRKPKGAAPGAVVVEREEVVMVCPRSGSETR
jgi:predicted ribosome quality control (RQC) complex YloA/Tae2 family protein